MPRRIAPKPCPVCNKALHIVETHERVMVGYWCPDCNHWDDATEMKDKKDAKPNTKRS
jgi:uncharacterized protein YbaR (Trm112 family)